MGVEVALVERAGVEGEEGVGWGLLWTMMVVVMVVMTAVRGPRSWSVHIVISVGFARRSRSLSGRV